MRVKLLLLVKKNDTINIYIFISFAKFKYFNISLEIDQS